LNKYLIEQLVRGKSLQETSITMSLFSMIKLMINKNKTKASIFLRLS